MLKRRRIGIVLRVLLMMIMYYGEILMNSSIKFERCEVGVVPVQRELREK